IDGAFQERVKRNYEMLSEAVQLMGMVAQGGQAASGSLRTPAARPRAAPAAPPTPEPVAPLPAADIPEGFAEIPVPPELEEPKPAAGGRSRGKGAPVATEEEFNAALAAASGAPEPEGGWTWKDLLTSIDGEGAGPDAELGQALFSEIETMGIDPAALLSRNRIEEIAAAIQTGDAEGARVVVRALAPAAIRRLTRRFLSDREFRQRSETYIGRYAAVIEEASKRDKEGFQAASLLNSSVGRAYLLLDAAAGDLP
ncbi:MAG TPA: polar localization protein TipN, partial [Caulobacteraceae bacterium]|nr:polar localization protein TipN [Caulobacteraceae bacterium]